MRTLLFCLICCNNFIYLKLQAHNIIQIFYLSTSQYHYYSSPILNVERSPKLYVIFPVEDVDQDSQKSGPKLGDIPCFVRLLSSTAGSACILRITTITRVKSTRTVIYHPEDLLRLAIPSKNITDNWNIDS